MKHWTSYYTILFDFTYLDEYGDFGQVGFPGFLGEALKACCGSGGAVDGGEESDRYSSTHYGQPHSGTHQGCVSASADGAGSERVDNSQEAVNADAGEEEHAAVDVGDECRSRDFAQTVPEGPVLVDIVEDFKRQCEDKHQVW